AQASTNKASGVYDDLWGILLAYIARTLRIQSRRSALRASIERGRKLFGRRAELAAMLLIEWVARGQRSRQLAENVREKPVMQVNHRLAPIFAGPHQPDRYAVGVGVGIELRVATKIAEIGFVGEIHRHFRLVGDRMQ